jgi:hypothetical protein
MRPENIRIRGTEAAPRCADCCQRKGIEVARKKSQIRSNKFGEFVKAVIDDQTKRNSELTRISQTKQRADTSIRSNHETIGTSLVPSRMAPRGLELRMANDQAIFA